MTPRHHAAIASSPDGRIAIAVAHRDPLSGEVVIDAARVMTVTGGEQGITAVYDGLRGRGIDVADNRADWPTVRSEDVLQRAIADVTAEVRNDYH